MIIPHNCKECNREYMAESRELKRGNGMFCSRQCSTDHNRRTRIPPKTNTICGYCTTPIYVKPSRLTRSKSGIVYCSSEHSLEGSKSGLHKPGPKANVTTTVCLRSELRGCKTKTRRESGICRSCETKDNIDLWLDGDVSVTWISTVKEPKPFVKKYLLETRGDRCEECSYDKRRPDGTSKIQMDHIDGNYMNNLISNLKLLCPNCHEDTPTFGSKNSGGGRRYRLAKALGK